MSTAKAEAIDAIARLPEDSDMEEILYRLYVLKKVREGRQSARTEPTLSTDELREDLERW